MTDDQETGWIDDEFPELRLTPEQYKAVTDYNARFTEENGPDEPEGIWLSVEESTALGLAEFYDEKPALTSDGLLTKEQIESLRDYLTSAPRDIKTSHQCSCGVWLDPHRDATEDYPCEEEE